MQSVLASRRTMLAGLALASTGLLLSWRAVRRSEALSAASELPATARSPVHVGAATLVNDVQPVPDFKAHGPEGEFNLARLTGQWSLVFFGYTQCPDVCPTTLSMLTQALAQVEASRWPLVLFISVDPARDTQALLAEYVPAFNPGFHGAAGQDADLAELVKHLGVHYERHVPGPKGQYTVDHTASLFLLDRQSRLKAVFSPPHDDVAGVALALNQLCV